MADSSTFLGKGWAFPPSFGAQGKQVAMVAEAQNIHQSLQVLFATSIGERVMLESYGCRLTDFIFEEIDQGLANNITSMLQNAINHHEQRVILDSIEVSQHDDVQGLLNISMSYTIRTTNSRYNMVYPFFVSESRMSKVTLNV